MVSYVDSFGVGALVGKWISIQDSVEAFLVEVVVWNNFQWVNL